MFASTLYCLGLAFAVSAQRPTPRLVFSTRIRIAEAYASSPGAYAGDGCIAARARLESGSAVISKVIFDAKKGRLRQSNPQLQKEPSQNFTFIGRWDLPTPREWDLTNLGGSVSCATEPLPPAMCPNGTLPPSCPPNFGTWGNLNAFTSILGMYYPNTTKVPGASTSTTDLYQYQSVLPTLLPNSACGTDACNMDNCRGCMHDGNPCTSCPCHGCIQEVLVYRNYSYTLAKSPLPDGTHQMLRYQWTQGIPLTKTGASPGIGRDCFIFDWRQDWTPEVQDSDFSPPAGVQCKPRVSSVSGTHGHNQTQSHLPAHPVSHALTLRSWSAKHQSHQSPHPFMQSCDSRRTSNVSIHSIANGNLDTLDVATASECEAACCADHKCTSWCFTPIKRLHSCPKHGCCFPKSADQNTTFQHIYPDPGFISGCLGFNCGTPRPHPPPPSPPPPPLPFNYVTPIFRPFGNTFANHATDALRDPTTAIFDTERGGHWHVYTTSMVCRGHGGGHCGGGYPGRIRHYSVRGTLAEGPAATSEVWTDEGLVLEPEYNTSQFDASGTFTPGIVKECDDVHTCRFYLFFGGVANQSASHTESVGVAIASSAWGPFVRYPLNPVFSVWSANTRWCYDSSTPARVDEIKATQIDANGTKVLVVKAVCQNFTALPVLWSPIDQRSWGPPYEVSPPSVARSPMVLATHTCAERGFEEPTLFKAPDGMLHLIGHVHGHCDQKYSHFISRSRSLLHWQEAKAFGSGVTSGNFFEPNPIPIAGDGVFGNDIRKEWIDFGPDVAKDGLHFTHVDWHWINTTLR